MGRPVFTRRFTAAAVGRARSTIAVGGGFSLSYIVESDVVVRVIVERGRFRAPLWRCSARDSL